MLWVVVDVVIGVLAVVILGSVAFSVYRHGRALSRALSTASARVGEAMPTSPAPRR